VQVLPGTLPEIPLGSPPMALGRWFEFKGVEFRPARTLGAMHFIFNFLSFFLPPPHTFFLSFY
jgi:hypothetical protein